MSSANDTPAAPPPPSPASGPPSAASDDRSLTRTLGSIWAWTSVLLVIFFGFWIQLLLFVVSRPFDPLRKVPGRFFRLMAVFCTKLNPFWQFRYVGNPVKPEGRLVFVSNHASNADVFLISTLPWEMKWLGKASLFRQPVFGWSMWMAGDIPVERGDKQAAAGSLVKCAGWVKKGMPVMIFPEGTRSLDGVMLPFKDGAFRLALETGARIVPLGVAGTHEALPKRSWRFGPGKGRVVVGAPIEAAGRDLKELKAEVRAAVEALVVKAEAASREG
jgi:1-acyl-sn-glycerol-3-phosphate acyltransferase